MKKIVLLSCVKKKLDHKSKAKDLYCSPLFKKSLKYAKNLNPDSIYILSAKYGVLSLNDKIDPYNGTLNSKSSGEIKQWSEKVLKNLAKKANLQEDNFIILAGKNYYKYLIPHIKKYKLPLRGLKIGSRLKFLNDKINSEIK